MRTLAILTAISTVFFFGFTAVLVAQPGGQGRGGQGQISQGPGGQRQIVITQSDGTQRTVVIPERTGEQVQTQPGGQRGQEGGMRGQMGGGPQGQGGGFPGQGQRGGTMPPGAQGTAPARPVQPPTAQGNQPPRPAQPGVANAGQVTQTMARLRAMDANQNGVLEASEIPADRRDRVNTWVTELGGNPNATSFNLAALERRAQTAAGNPQQPQQTNQQQPQPTGERQQQQRQPQAPPLVAPFGEQVTTEAPPLIFGQRNRPVQTVAPQARGERGQPRGTNQRNTAIPPPVAPRISTPYDNISANLRSNRNFSWFFEYDTDQDGQITMQEYVQGLGGTWTAGIASEFVGFIREDGSADTGLDRNGDGFATMEEVLATIKERDAWEAFRAAAQQTAEPASQPARASPGGTRPGSGQGAPSNAGARPVRSGQSSANNPGGRLPEGRQGQGPGGRGGARGGRSGG